jgi:hypothetical protein
VAQTMYTHMSKYKNDKIFKREKKDEEEPENGTENK